MSRYAPRVIGTVGLVPEVRAVIGWQQGELVAVRPVRVAKPTVKAALFYGGWVVQRMMRIYFPEAVTPSKGWADYYLEELGWMS